MTDKTYGPEKLTIEQMHSNRANAKAAGQSYYFTGKVCKWGHVVPRRLANGNCVECHRVEVKKHYYRYKYRPRRLLTMEEKAEKEKTMKKLLLIIFLLNVGLLSVFAADIPDTPGNRQAAAERYLSVAPLDSMMNDMVEKTAVNLPTGQRKVYVEFMAKYVRIQVLERAVVSSMARHFTVPICKKKRYFNPLTKYRY